MKKTRLTLQEELVVKTLMEDPGLSLTRLAKKTNIPRRELELIVKRPTVEQEIIDRRNALANESMITVKRVLDEETCLAFYDPKDFTGPNGEMLPIHQIPERLRRAIVRIIPRLVGEKMVYEYVLADKGRSLERISKHLGMYEQDNLQKAARMFFVRADELPEDVQEAELIREEEEKSKEVKQIAHGNKAVSILD